MPPISIEICLGSSCFARGSQRLAEAASAWIRAHPGAATLAGHRCQGRCGEGLRLLVDGRGLPVSSPEEVPPLIAAALEPRP